MNRFLWRAGAALNSSKQNSIQCKQHVYCAAVRPSNSQPGQLRAGVVKIKNLQPKKNKQQKTDRKSLFLSAAGNKKLQRR